MPRLGKVMPYSGQAAGREEAIENPQALVSRPLFLDQNGEQHPNLQRWEMPLQDVKEGLAVDYQRHRQSDPLVVIGGFHFLQEIGPLPRWFIHDATRDEARDLIRERGLEPLLESLSMNGREPEVMSLLGKGAIHDWFRYSPHVNREESPTQDQSKKAKKKRKASEEERKRPAFKLKARTAHCLRLRKAIDFVLLLESALAYRYRMGKTIARTSRYTELAEGEGDPQFVWDVLWFEPINYVLSVTPNYDHINALMERHDLVQKFTQDCGQQPGALYYILHGAPGKYDTVQAACEFLNSAYPPGFPPHHVMSCPPRHYRSRMKLFDELSAKTAFKRGVEFAPEMGPPSPT